MSPNLAGGPDGDSLDSLAADSARTMSNMLKDLTPDGGKEETPKPAGIYLGDGLPPVPARLAGRIGRWEFIEMVDLLPEFWSTLKPGESSAKRTKAKKRVQDINVWLQCFALYVGVMATKSPERVPELMAYMISILRASQEYDGSAWATYDAAYRRQAAATGHQRWSKINPSLYTVCFTGKARKAIRCDLCLSAGHKTEECSLAGEDDPDITQRMKAVESAVVAFSANPQTGGAPRGYRSPEVCRLFNEKRCRFRNCKYRHVCRICEGNHAAADCLSPTKQPDHRANTGPGPIRRDSQNQTQAYGGNPY